MADIDGFDEAVREAARAFAKALTMAVVVRPGEVLVIGMNRPLDRDEHDALIAMVDDWQLPFRVVLAEDVASIAVARAEPGDAAG